MTTTPRLKQGDLVRFNDYTYVISRTNKEGKLKLLGGQAGAPAVRSLVAPHRVTLVHAVREPVGRPGSRAGPDRERIDAIAERLREIRIAGGWSTRRLADAIGVSQPHLSRAELGRAPGPPSPDYLKRFADVTGADEDELCATAGVIPVDVAAALRDINNLRAVRLLIEKLEGTTA
jgi:transcriptional regulator with XRE-family HTH domain